MDKVAPLHSEKIIFYDTLAQVEIMMGNIEKARGAYQSAYMHSKAVHGGLEDISSIKELKSLCDDTPRNLDEMKKRYSS